MRWSSRCGGVLGEAPDRPASVFAHRETSPHRGTGKRRRPSRGGAPLLDRIPRQRAPPGPHRGDDHRDRSRRPIPRRGRLLAGLRRRRDRVEPPRWKPRLPALRWTLHPRPVPNDPAPQRVRERAGALHAARHGPQQPDRDRQNREEPGVLPPPRYDRDERDLGRAQRPDQAAHGPGRAHPPLDPVRRGGRRDHPEDPSDRHPRERIRGRLRTRSSRRPAW